MIFQKLYILLSSVIIIIIDQLIKLTKNLKFYDVTHSLRIYAVS